MFITCGELVFIRCSDAAALRINNSELYTSVRTGPSLSLSLTTRYRVATAVAKLAPSGRMNQI